MSTVEVLNDQDNAKKVLAEMGVEFTTEFIANKLHFEYDKKPRSVFNVTFKRGNKKFSLEFGQSYHDGKKAPTAYGVLACIQKYDVGDYKNFCDEFGDSSINTYKKVCSEFKKVSAFFTSEELEILQKIN